MRKLDTEFIFRHIDRTIIALLNFKNIKIYLNFFFLN